MDHGPIKSPLWEMDFSDPSIRRIEVKQTFHSNLEKRALEAFFDIKKSYEELSKISPASVDSKLKEVVETLRNFSELMEQFEEIVSEDESLPPIESGNE